MVAVINTVYDRKTLELISYKQIYEYEANHYEFYEKIVEAFYCLIERENKVSRKE